MINLDFDLSNPWSKRWENVWSKAYPTPHPSKYIEIERFKDNTIVSFTLRITTRQSHAGVMIGLGLLGHSVLFNFYDIRHWNTEAGRYFIYDEENGSH